MAVNYNDQRFAQVETDKKEALSELEQTYAGMIGSSDQYYNAQIDASKEWADKQTELQQEKTDFAIEQINQQKDQAKKDYTKEQSGAYVDWQKQSNAYGVNAEQTAAAGIAGSGFSESAQVSMYNTYQNRVATARDAYTRAVLNYDNAIKDARLQNNAVLAEIAYQALQTQLELSLQGFQYKNQLILDKTNKKIEVDNMYYGRYMDVLNQINTENALAEEQRQFEANMALQYAQIAAAQKEAEAGREHDLALVTANHEADKALAQYMAELESSQNNNGPGDVPGGVVPGGVDPVDLTVKPDTVNRNAVNTDYYSGPLNKDAKTYGTFSNGYQPKGIAGYGPVSKTGMKIRFETKTRSGKTVLVEQNVWKTPDGSRWYWEGRVNRYVRVPEEQTGGGSGGQVSGSGSFAGGGSGGGRLIHRTVK